MILLLCFFCIAVYFCQIGRKEIRRRLEEIKLNQVFFDCPGLSNDRWFNFESEVKLFFTASIYKDREKKIKASQKSNSYINEKLYPNWICLDGIYEYGIGFDLKLRIGRA